MRFERGSETSVEGAQYDTIQMANAHSQRDSFRLATHSIAVHFFRMKMRRKGEKMVVFIA